MRGIMAMRITGARITVELATNERWVLKLRAATNWRGASALMRGLYLIIVSLSVVVQ